MIARESSFAESIPKLIQELPTLYWISSHRKSIKCGRQVVLACGHDELRVPAQTCYFSLQNRRVAKITYMLPSTLSSTGTATRWCMEELLRTAWAFQQETRRHLINLAWVTNGRRPTFQASKKPASTIYILYGDICRQVEYSRRGTYGDVSSAADWVIPRVLSSWFP